MTTIDPRPTADTSQARHPWRATARTVFALIVALAAVWGVIVEAAGVDSTAPVIAASIAAAGAVTRIMALPGVADLFDRFAPFLLPEPRAVDADAPEYDEDPDGWDDSVAEPAEPLAPPLY